MTITEVLEKFPGTAESDWTRHSNGGGWVHKTAKVDPSAWVAATAVVGPGCTIGLICDICTISGGTTIPPMTLIGFDLDKTRADMFSILDKAAPEVRALKQVIVDGHIDGRIYKGECACLKGTIAKIRGCKKDELDGITCGLSDSPAEQLFYYIRPGHTPTNNAASKFAFGLIEEWEAKQK